MKLQSCSNTHFIQAIRGGLVIKVPNTNSHGRPALSFKTLEYIYGKDAKRLHQPSAVTSHNMLEGSAFNHDQVKSEIPCLPVVDRSLRDVIPEADEFVPHADDGSDSDLDDKTTLKQLAERFLRKKRKFSCSVEISNLAYANEKPVADDSNLNEPLINWIPKKSKYSKAKRKCMNGSIVSTSTVAFAIKSEQNLIYEVSPQVGCDLPPVRVKTEVHEDEELGHQNKISLVDNSSIGHKEVPSDGEPSNGFSSIQRDNRELLVSREECQNCVTNYMSYDHLEDAEPTSMLVSSDGMSVELETIELDCNEVTDLPPVAIQLGEKIMVCRGSLSNDENSDVCMLSESSTIMEEISEQSISSGVQVADLAFETTNNVVLFVDRAKKALPHQHDNSISTPDENCSSSLKTDDIVVSMEDARANEQPLICLSDDITKIGWNTENDMEDELLNTDEEKQTSAFTAGENQFSTENQTFDSADRVSTPEQHQHPERLPSTRKAISPSSQEQLCLAMNSVELCNEIDQFKCKEKLFEKQTEEQTSTLTSDIKHAKITFNGAEGKVNQRKVIISPRHTTKAQDTIGYREPTRLSSTLPNNLNTGCMSIERCSESAIAFSQRQMYDMESLAAKLMNELKSMTDVVEKKLLFEAYRNVSLKNDADEVKSAINSANKMEKVARKWISVMARDCNRFCKIMELTPNGVAASKHAVPSKKRKIVFADEAGGKLCHVKYFENSVISPLPNDVNQ